MENKKNMVKGNEQNKNEMEGKNMESKKVTLVEVKTAMANADNAHANTDSLIACEYLDAMEDMDSTFTAYNNGLLADAYGQMNSLADLYKRGHYSPLHSQWDKKNNCFRAVARTARLNALDFAKVKKVEKGEEFSKAVEKLAEQLAAFIKSEVSYDGTSPKSVNIKTVVPLLKAVFDCVGIPDVMARNRDVRFLAYSCTGGAGAIGALREVNPARVATMLVDVYTVQMSGGAYDFEKKDADK